jgi:DNA-binding CsgD family transcriptional regulator
MSNEDLTPAERRVMNLAELGLRPSVIAQRLGVSRNTVETHLRSIYKKLGRGPDDTPPAAAAGLPRTGPR